MQIVDCNHCRLVRACPQPGQYHLQVVSAVLDGRDAAPCSRAVPVYLRGVEGVFKVQHPTQLFGG